MRRGILILSLALIGALVGYYCCYLLGTSEPRALLKSAQPELSWLKNDFQLTDAEFQRISELHAGYLPQCRERCREVDRLNDELAGVLSKVKEVTPEVTALLTERARVWSVCQNEMLKHFFEVSRTMPAEQGTRYLEWVSKNTHIRQKEMSHGRNEGAPSASSSQPHR